MAAGRNAIPTFPGRLRELREAAGLSRAGLAEKAGTSESAVSALERGERSPSLELAARLADAVGASVERLLEPPGTPWRPKKDSRRIRPTSVDSPAD